MTYLFSLALGFISLCLPVERLLAHADRRRRRTTLVIGNHREVF
jgi:hypothetical protein